MVAPSRFLALAGAGKAVDEEASPNIASSISLSFEKVVSLNRSSISLSVDFVEAIDRAGEGLALLNIGSSRGEVRTVAPLLVCGS